MQEAILQLKQLVNGILPLPEEDWQAFEKLWQPFSSKRKELITVAGAAEKYMYFVAEGVQRVYYFDDKGREATLVFTYPPSFGGVLDAMLLKQSSKYCYETLTASNFLRAPYSEMEALMKRSIAVSNMMLLGLSAATAGLLERLVEVQSFSSEQKFKKLLQRSPHILQLVPHKYLANYLGMDATNFSKLMNSVRL